MKGGFWERLAARVEPTDTLKTIENPKVIVRAITGAALLTIVQVLVFVALLAMFDEPAVAWAAAGLAGAFLVGWISFAATGSIFIPFVIAFPAATFFLIYAHVALGGYAYSGAILLFGIPWVSVVALLLGGRMAAVAGLIHATAGVILAFLEPSLQASRPPPDPTLTTILFVAAFVGSINAVAPLIVYFMGRLRYERERAERLLLNVLPAEVARELKEHGSTRARRFESVSVLFADIVGFTPMTAEMDPEAMVERLNEAFTHFDSLTERYGCEKIRTQGDSYMVAAGVPTPRDDHAQVLAQMALDMLAYSKQGPLSLRIGINSGPVVAGVIGTHKFQYDIWGDTVNIASRMESHGEAGRIQITRSTYELVRDVLSATPRGPVEVKGKGTLTTWWLDSPRESAPTASRLP